MKGKKVQPADLCKITNEETFVAQKLDGISFLAEDEHTAAERGDTGEAAGNNDGG